MEPGRRVETELGLEQVLEAVELPERLRLVAFGEVYPDRVLAIAAETSAQYARARPRAGDWNEDLRVLVARLEKELTPAAE